MDVIEKLIAGHRDVFEKRDILSKLIKALDTDAFFWDKADKVSFFFKKEIREHFAMEERVLFPVLKKILAGKDIETLSEIETEHVSIIKKLDGFNIVSDNHQRYASKVTREHLIRSAFELIEVISAHAEKEDKRLFPLIKEKLGAENRRELEELYFKFLKV